MESDVIANPDVYMPHLQEHKTKQPYYVHLDGDPIMRMAGLYDSWQDAEGNWLYTYTILTTDSSKRLQWYMSVEQLSMLCIR